MSKLSSDREGWQRKTRRRSIIREFALNTSTHALPSIARSENKHGRLFWAFSFILFTGIMVFFIVQSIMNYFGFPTQTTINIVVERDQLFPAVTICSYCPARFDRVIGPLLNYTNSRNLTNTNDTSTISPEHIIYLRDFMIHLVNTHTDLKSKVFSLGDMLMSCSYNGITCNASDFISFFSTNFGMCYTFNARLQNSRASGLRRVNDNGGSGKLQLELYAHNHIYVPWVLHGKLFSLCDRIGIVRHSIIFRCFEWNGCDASRQCGGATRRYSRH